MHPFVAARILRLSFDVHALPADDQLSALLHEHGVIDEPVDPDELSAWLGSAIKSDDAVDVMVALQAATDDAWGKGVMTKLVRKHRPTRVVEVEEIEIEVVAEPEPAPVKKPAAKKAPTKKPAAKKAPAKKPAAKKAPAKKPAAKKAPAKKPAAKKAPAKKPAAKKAPAKKASTKKTPAKKSATKKPAAKKKVAKKSAKKGTGRAGTGRSRA
ncbi:MAG: histone [Phycisphaera sp.]|nr:histone [Phycisphaera sp.]